MPCQGDSSSQAPGTALLPLGYRETLILEKNTFYFQFPTPKLSKFPFWERRRIKTQQICKDTRELKELNLSFLLKRKRWTRCPTAAGRLSPSATRWSLQHGSLSPRRGAGAQQSIPTPSQLGSSTQPLLSGAVSPT